MSISNMKVLSSDVAILKKLANKVSEIAHSKRNQECIRLWHKHDLCQGERPLLLAESNGGLKMVIKDFKCRTQEAWAQKQEEYLLKIISHFELIGDDNPVEPYVNVHWHLNLGNYGIDSNLVMPDTDGTRGAYHIDAVLTDLERDIHKLRHRQFQVDREGTLSEIAVLEDIYDGILKVRLRGHPLWTFGITQPAIKLIGLEQLMLYMYDQPEALHQLMAFLRDDHFALIDWMEREGLLTLNNENDYIGSGSRGYTYQLPQKDGKQDSKVLSTDTWALLESQETVGVGPDMYEQFIFPYENALAEKFGGIYYGCCEPLHGRWNIVKNMVNLKRISISPWCDEEYMAAELSNKMVYSRKPKPTMISTEKFDEDAIYSDFLHTMQVAKKNGCTLEIVMKDVHTLNGEHDRMTRWINIGRKAIAEVYG